MKSNGKIYYGHILMAVCFFIYMGTVGLAGYGNPIITTRLVADNGWDHSVIGNSTSMFQLGQAIGLMVLAPFFNKMGAKKIIVAGMSVGVLGYLYQIFIKPVGGWPYALTFVLCGISAASGLLCCPALMNLWFTRRKSLPISLIRTASTVGGIIFPVVVNMTITTSPELAWGSFMVMSIVMIVMAILFVKQDPSDIGEIPDSRAWVERHPLPAKKDAPAAEATKEAAKEEAPKKAKSSFRESYGSFQFISLSLITCIQRFMLFSVQTFAMIYIISKGMDSANAAYIMSVYSSANAMGRFLPAASDLLPLSKKNQMAVTMFVLCGGMAAFTVGKSIPVLFVACGAIGLFNGLYSSLFPIVVSDFFKKEDYATTYSTLNVIGSIAGVVVPMLVSAIQSSTGSYLIPFSAAIVLLVIGGVMTLAVHPASEQN